MRLEETFGRKAITRGKNRSIIPGMDIVKEHFEVHADLDHPSYPTLRAAVDMLGRQPAQILETGSSAWGARSTELFDRYVRNHGGEFYSVDIRQAPAHQLRKIISPATTMIVGNSTEVMARMATAWADKFDLIYLDSFDLEFDDPMPAMVHGLAEFVIAEKLVKVGGRIVIDDSPSSPEIAHAVSERWKVIADRGIGPILPGKGAFITKLLNHDRFKIVRHDYQMMLQRLM